MRTCGVVLLALGVLVGCTTNAPEVPLEQKKLLKVRWQRLVDGGQTCERCGSTEAEIQEAVGSLRNSLNKLGIEVVREKSALDPQTFAKDVSQSNRIWIGERTLEDWLGAKTGKSDCRFCCSALGGKAECRTMVIDGQTYESIPAKLIVKAGLLAGAELLEAPPKGSCCGPGGCGPGGCGPK